MQTMAVIEKVLECAKVKAKPDAVFHATMKVGDYHRQGDVYIWRVAQPDRSALKEIKLRIQLAPGASMGSRHCISGATARNLRMYEKPNATPLDGPVIEAFSPVEIDHPEHGNVTIPAGWYEVTYQRQMADELRSVVD